MLETVLEWVLAGVVGNSAYAGVRRALADARWQSALIEVVARAEGVKLRKRAFRAWLADPTTAELISRHVGEEFAPELVARELVTTLRSSGALPRRDLDASAWRALAEAVVSATLLALPMMAPENATQLMLVLSDTTSLKAKQTELLEAVLGQRELFDALSMVIQGLRADLRRGSPVVLDEPTGFRPSYDPTLRAFSQHHAQLFGRKHEISDLQQRVSAGGYIVIEGPAWCGKTALMTHLARALASDGCRVVRFYIVENSAATPSAFLPATIVQLLDLAGAGGGVARNRDGQTMQFDALWFHAVTVGNGGMGDWS